MGAQTAARLNLTGIQAAQTINLSSKLSLDGALLSNEAPSAAVRPAAARR